MADIRLTRYDVFVLAEGVDLLVVVLDLHGCASEHAPFRRQLFLQLLLNTSHARLDFVLDSHCSTLPAGCESPTSCRWFCCVWWCRPQTPRRCRRRRRPRVHCCPQSRLFMIAPSIRVVHPIFLNGVSVPKFGPRGTRKKTNLSSTWPFPEIKHAAGPAPCRAGAAGHVLHVGAHGARTSLDSLPMEKRYEYKSTNRGYTRIPQGSALVFVLDVEDKKTSQKILDGMLVRTTRYHSPNY
jgi:hypothetical protein